MDKISFNMLEGDILLASKSAIPKSVERIVFPS